MTRYPVHQEVYFQSEHVQHSTKVAMVNCTSTSTALGFLSQQPPDEYFISEKTKVRTCANIQFVECQRVNKNKSRIEANFLSTQNRSR